MSSRFPVKPNDKRIELKPSTLICILHMLCCTHSEKTDTRNGKRNPRKIQLRSSSNDHDLRICHLEKYLYRLYIYILNKCKHTAAILTTNLGGVSSRRLLILKTRPQPRHSPLRKGFRLSGWVPTERRHVASESSAPRQPPKQHPPC